MTPDDDVGGRAVLHRTTRTLWTGALTAAVLLAGCSSSPAAEKLASEVDAPVLPAMPPTEDLSSAPDDGTVPAESSDAPLSGDAPATPSGDADTAPARDVLAGADTSDASDEQAAEIEDRDVTLEEYHAAFDRFSQCMTAAGFELGSGHFSDGRYHFTVPGEAVADGADHECYQAEFIYVDML